MKKPICVISEDLSQPVDEGIKHFAHSLIESWSEEHDVLGLSLRTTGRIDGPHTEALRVNKTFIDAGLSRRLRAFRPEIICYVPSASATVSSFLRSRVLKLNRPATKVVMVALQPRNLGWISRRLLPLISPDTVFVQNETAMKRLGDAGCRARLLPSGVDNKKFVPVSPSRKVELRTRYGLDTQAFTVLHVGHAAAGRNIDFLNLVRRESKAQVIFVGSSLRHSGGKELVADLRRQGVIVLDKYFPDIEEIYQLADCYLFPVFSDQSCIGVPLSVLEAMACNLPVVSVRYGTLPGIFGEGQGLVYADNPEGLLLGLQAVKNLNGNCRTREKVAPYSWQAVARYILEQTLGAGNN
ncbi:MAG: hypothetical protein A2Z29_02825 [Chloroflexi bacterium RBG_16_56_11]|nr:MAG: hypothetical protein A2Z29_02825 [Chloroflexi bacterium RBG_16_56_11]